MSAPYLDEPGRQRLQQQQQESLHRARTRCFAIFCAIVATLFGATSALTYFVPTHYVEEFNTFYRASNHCEVVGYEYAHLHNAGAVVIIFFDVNNRGPPGRYRATAPVHIPHNANLTAGSVTLKNFIATIFPMGIVLPCYAHCDHSAAPDHHYHHFYRCDSIVFEPTNHNTVVNLYFISHLLFAACVFMGAAGLYLWKQQQSSSPSTSENLDTARMPLLTQRVWQTARSQYQQAVLTQFTTKLPNAC